MASPAVGSPQSPLNVYDKGKILFKHDRISPIIASFLDAQNLMACRATHKKGSNETRSIDPLPEFGAAEEALLREELGQALQEFCESQRAEIFFSAPMDRVRVMCKTLIERKVCLKGNVKPPIDIMAELLLETWHNKDEQGLWLFPLQKLYCSILGFLTSETWRPSLSPLVESYLHEPAVICIPEIISVLVSIFKQKLRQIEKIDDFEQFQNHAAYAMVFDARGKLRCDYIFKRAFVELFAESVDLSKMASWLFRLKYTAAFDSPFEKANEAIAHLFFKQAAVNYRALQDQWFVTYRFQQYFPSYLPCLKDCRTSDEIAFLADLRSRPPLPFSNKEIVEFLCTDRKEIFPDQVAVFRKYLNHEIAYQLAQEYPERLVDLCEKLGDDSTITVTPDQESLWIDFLTHALTLNSEEALKDLDGFHREVFQIGKKLLLQASYGIFPSNALLKASLKAAEQGFFSKSTLSLLCMYPAFIRKYGNTDIFIKYQKLVAAKCKYEKNFFVLPEDPEEFQVIKEEAQQLCMAVANHETYFAPIPVFDHLSLGIHGGCCGGVTLQLNTDMLKAWDSEDFESLLAHQISRYEHGVIPQAFIKQVVLETCVINLRVYKVLLQGLLQMDLDPAVQVAAIYAIAASDGINKGKAAIFLKDNAIDPDTAPVPLADPRVQCLISTYSIFKTIQEEGALLAGISQEITNRISPLLSVMPSLRDSMLDIVNERSFYAVMGVAFTEFVSVQEDHNEERLRCFAQTAPEGVYVLRMEKQRHAITLIKRKDKFYLVDPNPTGKNNEHIGKTLNDFMVFTRTAFDLYPTASGQHNLSFFKMTLN